MMKTCSTLTAVLLLAAMPAMASFTVATFDDPSPNSTQWLFEIDWLAGTVDGGWQYDGLNLKFGPAFDNQTYQDVRFTMDTLQIELTQDVWGTKYGKTQGGQIDFYELGNQANPVFVIAFDEAVVSRFGLAQHEGYENNMWLQNVTFSGSAIGSVTLENQQFGFSFANVEAPDGGSVDVDGFTATAALTSSAIPEPTTLVMLGMGCAALLRRRK